MIIIFNSIFKYYPTYTITPTLVHNSIVIGIIRYEIIIINWLLKTPYIVYNWIDNKLGISSISINSPADGRELVHKII